jgi:allantoin racemase
MQIRIVTPITTPGFTLAEDFQPLARWDTEVSCVGLDRGPASIESEFDEALAVPDTIAKIMEAEQEGIDAVVIDCMGDPGLEPAREVVNIPVVGAAQASMHLASMLAHNFSIVTVLDTLVPLFENTARVYGLESKLCSVRSVNIPVLELEEDQDRLISALVEESIKAVEEDGAHAIVFGCTGMKGCAAGLKVGLEALGYENIPVIDPVIAAFKLAEAVVDLGVSHSKRTYPQPPQKEIIGFDNIPGREWVPA